MAMYDYELENDLAVKALKEAAALRGAKAVDPTLQVGKLVVPNFAGIFDRFQQQTQGNRMEDQATARLRELGTAQQGEVDAYIDAIKNPPKVLRQGEGPLLDPTRDMDPTELNQYQMEQSMGAMSLPKAKAMATQFFNSGVGYPEKVEQLRLQKALDAEKARIAAAERAETARLNRENAMAIAQLNAGGRAETARETREAKAEEKRSAAEEKASVIRNAHVGSLGEIERRVGDILATPGLDVATGGFQGRLPAWVSLSPDTKSTVASKIKNLQEYLQTKGLQDLRAAGVAPGSVTEREWSKFAARIGNIDPTLSDTEFVKELKRVKDEAQAEMQRLMGTPQAAPSPAPKGQTPPSSGLTVGTVVDGYRYKGGDKNKESSWELAR